MIIISLEIQTSVTLRMPQKTKSWRFGRPRKPRITEDKKIPRLCDEVVVVRGFHAEQF